MSEETRKDLEMVATGQISTSDAEKLLEKLGRAASLPCPGFWSPASLRLVSGDDGLEQTKPWAGLNVLILLILPLQRGDLSTTMQAARFKTHPTLALNPGRAKYAVRIHLRFDLIYDRMLEPASGPGGAEHE